MKQYEIAFKTLAILADGLFHSGEMIANELGFSRVSIWKAINDLKELNVEVFSVRKKGYRLPKAIKILSEKKIVEALGELSQFVNFELLNVVDSTNKYLLNQSKNKPHATVVCSNLQTNGKGRRGRVWQSALGESITMSILWKFNFGASQLSGLSLVIGIALQRVMQKIGIYNSSLKWPNDVLVDANDDLKKIAGVLIELQGDMESRCSAVIGVGLNFDLSTKQQKKIDQLATSITSVSSKSHDPNEIVSLIIKEIVNVLSDFEKTHFESFKTEWLDSRAFKDQKVQFQKGSGEKITGNIIDLDDDGSLLLLKDDGKIEKLLSGEVSSI
jgi:BirA family biotin operon repressor/biotin-[acetyl-CoA-carboxylase] ligase